MLEKIKQLEKLSRLLETDLSDREKYLREVARYSEDFLTNLDEKLTYVDSKDKGIGIYDSPISDEPVELNAVLNLLRTNVDEPGINPASGGHLGYIPGGGLYLSSLADYLADITNRYAGIFFASPGAVRMENLLLKWMADLIGYPENAAGNLTSGGSISNLIAITTARDAFNLKAKDYNRCVAYMTRQVHHSIDKALRIAGLKECVDRFIPVDENFRMDTAALEDAIIKDRESGLIPWLIVSSAGTTDTGSVDPVEQIGKIAEKYSLWHHVDGAYGAFFILSDTGKKILKGLNKSDSIVMDPHKGLFLPYGTGAVLVKDKKKLFDSYYYEANYMQDALASNEELSPADLSPELSKHFRGLRLWLPLKLLGLKPFRAALEEKIYLARYFYQQLSELDNFELGFYPDLSIVTFRYIPKHGNANQFNQLLLKEIHKDGRVFLSSTLLNNNFTIRAAILSFRTHLNYIDLTINILKEKIVELEKTL